MPPSSRRTFLTSILGTGAALALAPQAAAKVPDSPPTDTSDPTATVGPTATPQTHHVTTWLNGAALTAKFTGEETVLNWLRNDRGLTGTKEGCGHGACGACTVLVDSKPTCACLLPVTALHQKKVDTIESFGTLGKLHPVQRAFTAHDALQCGYCTPGFVTEAIAFYAQWRADRGTETPTRTEIASAFAGHLCRCGAYEQIYAAVAAACAGEFDGAEVSPARLDAVAKVTGAAKYTVDIQNLAMAHGWICRSTIPHGTIRRLDLEPAKKLPGVKAAITLVPQGGKVRFVGQEIAAIAAVTREQAEAAAAAIVIEYEPLPAVISAASALAENAPVIYGSDKEAPNSSEFPMFPSGWEGNTRGPTRASIMMKQSAADKAVDNADNVVVNAQYTTSEQAHTTLEPHAIVCHWHDGGLEVWLSTQAIDTMAQDIAEAAHLTRDRVRVHAEYVGGGFGSKANFDPQILACIDLSRACQTPVRLANTRFEEIAYAGARPAVRSTIRLAATKAGKPAGLVVESYNDGGACVGNSTGVSYRLMYPYDEKRIEEWDVTTNAPIARAMRGPGGPAAAFVLESAMDALAASLKLSPLALRKAWDVSPLRQRLYAAAEKVPWFATPAPSDGRFQRGVGLASGVWPYFYQPNTQITVTLEGGKLTASTAAQDIGNGTRTVIAETIARHFGISRDLITVLLGDSIYPTGVMSAGSRTTASVGPVAMDAADQIIDALVDVATAQFSLTNAKAVPGGIEHATGRLEWSQVFAIAPRITCTGKRKRDPAGQFLPITIADVVAGKRLAAGLQIVEVEVDRWLGRVRVTRSWSGIAAGRMVAPILAKSQVCGGVIQGIGYALYEQRRIDPVSGRIVTANLEDYRIPGIGDTPEMEVHFDQDGFDDVVGGGIGMSELCTVPVAAAVGNAIRAATGWAPQHLPIQPGDVLTALAGRSA